MPQVGIESRVSGRSKEACFLFLHSVLRVVLEMTVKKDKYLRRLQAEVASGEYDPPPRALRYKLSATYYVVNTHRSFDCKL
jgi:hypothetical protein